MRIWGIITVLILAGLGFFVTFFFTDAWIQKQIEYQGSVANGAKVEFDGFGVSLFTLGVKWDRLQVANKNNTMQNTIETGPVEFGMELWPLIIKNKVIVDNVKLTGFQMNTERETDGFFEVPEKEKNKEPGFISEVITQVSDEAKRNATMKITEVADNINVDSLMAKVQIESPQKMEALKGDLEQNYQKWDSTFAHTDVREETREIKQQVENINLKEIKKPKEAIKALDDIKQLKKKVEGLKIKAENLKNEFQEDAESSKNKVGRIDNWIKDDIQKALQLAQIPDLDAQSIGKALFGENLLGDYAAYLEYIAMARMYGSRFMGDEEEEPAIPRYEGVDYSFSDKYDGPGFWFKNIELSGITNSGLQLSGVLTNLSSDQRKAGEPTEFMLSGEDEQQVSLSLNGEFNYMEEKPHEQFKLSYEGFSVKHARLSGSDLLPYELQSGKGAVSAELNIIDKRIDSRVDYNVSGISFDFESAGAPKNRVESLIRDAIGNADNIEIAALIDNKSGPLNVKLRSNVDDLFLNALKQTVSKEIEDARNKIEAKVRGEVENKKAELEKFRAEKEAALREKYAKIEATVNEQLEAVEEKKEELEKKKKELESAVKDKVKDKIGIDF